MKKIMLTVIAFLFIFGKAQALTVQISADSYKDGQQVISDLKQSLHEGLPVVLIVSGVYYRLDFPEGTFITQQMDADFNRIVTITANDCRVDSDTNKCN